MTKKLLLLSMGLAAFASCSKDTPIDSGVEGGTAEIRFDIGFAPQPVVASNRSVRLVGPDGAIIEAAAEEVPMTRVFTDPHFASTWQEGDQIGLFACTAGTTLAASGNHIHNAKITYSNGTWIAETPLYWPGSGGKLDFYAYYPFNEAATDPTGIAFRAMSDQSAAIDFSKSQLMAAISDNSGNGWGKGETVTLRFDHAMAMVQLSVDNRGGLLDESGEVSATLYDAKLAATFSLGSASQPAPEGDETPVKMFRLEQPGDNNYTTQFTFRAFVPGGQQIAARTTMFHIESGGRAFASAPLASPLDLAAGQVELFGQTPQYSDYALFIPDSEFRAYCLARFDSDQNGRLSLSEVLAVTEININSLGINSLEGRK